MLYDVDTVVMDLKVQRPRFQKYCVEGTLHQSRSGSTPRTPGTVLHATDNKPFQAKTLK